MPLGERYRLAATPLRSGERVNLRCEPELGEATARGRIAEFERMGWDPAVVPDPQDPETFRRSKLAWDEIRDGRHARLLDLHRTLIALRRREPDLTDPRFDRLSAQFSEDPKWIRIRRGALEIVVNLADEPLALGAPREVLFATQPPVDGSVPPRSGAIIRP